MAVYKRRSYTVTFGLVSAADGTAITSGSPSAYVTKDNGAQVAASATPTHKGNGQWALTLSSSETNAENVGVIVTLSGALPVQLTLTTTPYPYLVEGALPDQAAAGASEVILGAGASATDDIYNDHILLVYGDGGAKWSARIVDYVGATKTATLAVAKPLTIATGDYTMVVAQSHNVPDVSDVVSGLMAHTIDTLSVEKHLELMAAVLYGVVAIDVDGATVRFKNMSGASDRVVAVTTSDGKRTSVTRS